MPETTSGLWGPQDVYRRSVTQSWPKVYLSGFNLVTPSSIVATGTGSSATITSNGSVSFSDCTSIALNGVFSNYYTNYKIVYQGTSAVDGTAFQMYLRSNNQIATGTTDYDIIYLYLSSTSVNIARQMSTTLWEPISVSGIGLNDRTGADVYVYGPYKDEPTSIIATSTTRRLINENATGTHKLFKSYDGFLLNAGTVKVSGNLYVYGIGAP